LLAFEDGSITTSIRYQAGDLSCGKYQLYLRHESKGAEASKENSRKGIRRKCWRVIIVLSILNCGKNIPLHQTYIITTDWLLNLKTSGHSIQT